MISSDKNAVSLFVDQCVAHGMLQVVCSPGSRNAPLVIAFDEHPNVICKVIHDERSAAFFALGMAQQLGQPVGVVCTSGSAALNYYPAIAEAYYQCVPLVVITADRPQEWVDQGDGQTIRQQNVFDSHIRYSVNLSEKYSLPTEKWYLERETAIAFNEGNGNWKGPIHFNISLNEPLYNKVEYSAGNPKLIRSVDGGFQFSSNDRHWVENSMQLERKLLIVGQMDYDPALVNELIAFANDSSVAVLVENTSNAAHASFVHCIDRALNRMNEEDIHEYSPELLITVGGAVVSKRVKAFLRKNPPKQHWRVGHAFPYMDTYQSLSHTFITDAFSFFKNLNQLDYPRSKSNYGAKWRQLDLLSKYKLEAFFQVAQYSDVSVFYTLLDYLPEPAHLHMANSSVVRYCQLFDPIKGVRYWSNRGTSGIDGSTSTAVGAAHAKPDDLHVLITGDVSFFYDSNGLWNKYLSPFLRIILINNGGGGIFRIIPGPDKSAQLETFFEAQHHYSAEGIAATFQLDYLRAESIDEIESQMLTFYEKEENGRAKLLEIVTPTEINSEILEEFFQFLKV